MMQVLYAGAIMGLALFLSKFLLFFFLPRWVKKTIGFNNFTLLVTDIILGVLAAKTLSIADGTIALGASITFGLCSIAFLLSKKAAKGVTKIGGNLCASVLR
jgi:hypothetical protein